MIQSFNTNSMQLYRGNPFGLCRLSVATISTYIF